MACNSDNGSDSYFNRGACSCHPEQCGAARRTKSKDLRGAIYLRRPVTNESLRVDPSAARPDGRSGRLCENPVTALDMMVEWRCRGAVEMGHVCGVERTQAVLFPQSLDEYINEDNPVRFIDAYVASLDLVELGFAHATPSSTGRPAYDPGDLLRLYIYGYLNRVRSSRRLEKEAQRNVELMWLMRKLRPDFKTIADFRVDNRSVLTAVFKQFVCFCRELDMFGGELVAIDGSKFRASNSRARIFTAGKLADRLQRIEEQIRAYLAELDHNDQEQEQTVQDPSSAQDLQDKIAKLRERQQHYRALQQEM